MLSPIDYFKTQKKFGSENAFNLLREYLQVMTLKILYTLKDSEFLRFGGGTCLRICHNLPRYSEDLDFSLDKRTVNVTKIMHQLKDGFKQYNVDFELSVPKSIDGKRVAKYWLKFPGVLPAFGFSPHGSEKLNIKLEIDKHPPKKSKGEFFYVQKFEQYFPIFKNDLPTLFSGKIAAIFQRPYDAMRDFYDLLWYLHKGIQPNFDELKELGIRLKNREELVNMLRKKIKNVEGEKIVSTLQNLLENPVEAKILKNYPATFEQAAQKFLMM